MKGKTNAFWMGFCVTATLLGTLTGFMFIDLTMGKQGLETPPLVAWHRVSPIDQSFTLLGRSWALPMDSVNQLVGWAEEHALWIFPRTLRLAGQLTSLVAQSL